MSTVTRASILVSTLGALACLSGAALAETPPAPASAPGCPATYERLVERLCFHRTTGDIVFAQEPGAVQVHASADCRPGYAILFGRLCFNDVTGDVELPSDGPAITASQAR